MAIEALTLPTAAAENFNNGDVNQLTTATPVHAAQANTPHKNLAARDNLIKDKLNEVIGQVNAGMGISDVVIETLDPDDVSPATNETLWGGTKVVRFPANADGIAYGSFEKPDNWSDASDINFTLGFSGTVNGVSGEKVSLRMLYCVVGNNEVADLDTAPDANLEEEIDMASALAGASKYLVATNIRIQAAHIPAGDCRIIFKIVRDVDGVAVNYSGGFDLISLVATSATA